MSKLFIERAAKALGVSVRQIRAKDRHTANVRRRQAIAHVMRDNILILDRPVSYPRIARTLGYDDHTTVLHAIHMSRRLAECDEEHAAMVGKLEAVV